MSPLALLAIGYYLLTRKKTATSGVGADFRTGPGARGAGTRTYGTSFGPTSPAGQARSSSRQAPGGSTRDHVPGSSTRTQVDPNDPNMVWVQDASGGHWERKSADPATAAQQQGLVDPTTQDPNYAQQYYGGVAYPGNYGYGNYNMPYGPPGGYGGMYGGAPAGYGGYQGGYGGYGAPGGAFSDNPYGQQDDYSDWMAQYAASWQDSM